MKFATHRILDSIWVIGYKEITSTDVELILYSRNTNIGPIIEDKVAKGTLGEDDNRNVTSLSLKTSDGPKFYKVLNSKHKFSYNAH